MAMIDTQIFNSLIHVVSSNLLIPVIVLLVIFLVLVVLLIGSFINEYFTKKTITKNQLEEILQNINKSTGYSEIVSIIEDSTLHKEQKDVLIQITNNHNLGSEAKKALALNLIEEEELNYAKIITRSDLLVRLGPIFGLLGTLIPLGPGLTALSTGDINTLSQALITAFDTTVVGLTVGGLAFIVSKIRKQWYQRDNGNTETIANAILEKLETY